MTNTLLPDCAQAGCSALATHVIIESHPLALVFRSGAGLVCAEHAKQYEEVGGVPCSIKAFLQAAYKEHTE